MILSLRQYHGVILFWRIDEAFVILDGQSFRTTLGALFLLRLARLGPQSGRLTAPKVPIFLALLYLFLDAVDLVDGA